MQIVQIMSNARRRTVIYKPDSGPSQVRYFPVGTTSEVIFADLEMEETAAKKKSRKKTLPEDDKS